MGTGKGGHLIDFILAPRWGRGVEEQARATFVIHKNHFIANPRLSCCSLQEECQPHWLSCPPPLDESLCSGLCPLTYKVTKGRDCVVYLVTWTPPGTHSNWLDWGFSVIALRFYCLGNSWLFLLTHRYRKCLTKTVTSHTNSPLVLWKICPWNTMSCPIYSRFCCSVFCVSLPFLHPALGIPVFIHITIKEVKNSICNDRDDDASQRANGFVCHWETWNLT